MNPPLLEFSGVGKSFHGVAVLRDIRFAVGAGRITALVGENGAGKSTLMNILGGNLRPDTGTLQLAGAPYAPRDAREAARAGVAQIHQELNLFTNLTVAENLFLTDFPVTPGLPLIRPAVLRTRAAALLARVGLDLPPDTPVDRLSTGECQLVEIAKALAGAARVIVFDEPTTSLTARETDRLFALMRELRAAGHALIFISHNLGDVLRLSDDIVVLRDGTLIAAEPAAQFTADRLVSLMVGRSLTQLFPARAAPPGREPALTVRGVSQPGIVENISFTLHRGEVLGLSGLMGAGRSELARILFGLDPRSAGEILVGERPLPPGPRAAIEHGLAFVTEDRRADGLLAEAAIADNLALVTLPRHAARATGWLSLAGLGAALTAAAARVQLTARAGLGQPVRTLSGGNQQKVILARWLLSEPAVLILDEPTRGIDVGAKAEIYALIHAAAARGAGILVISSELEELIGLCDRLLVLNRGEVRDELARPDFDRERILRSALPASP
jgi:ribose transport system ATP-binding protein